MINLIKRRCEISFSPDFPCLIVNNRNYYNYLMTGILLPNTSIINDATFTSLLYIFTCVVGESTIFKRLGELHVINELNVKNILIYILYII